MSLFNKINLSYVPIFSSLPCLSKEEWTDMIKLFIDKLCEKPIGRFMIDKLNQFINKGYKITIANNDFKYNVTVFPKIRYINNTQVLIVIPSVPYFIECEVIDNKICDDIDDDFIKNIKNISNGLPSNKLLDFSLYEFLISVEKISGFISFAHELVHCLRLFEHYYINNELEEDNTIYGIESTILSYNVDDKKMYITENAIRKEWNINCRISHNSKPLLCYGVESTYSNEKLFSKESFYN